MLKNFFILAFVCVFLIASNAQAGPLDRLEHYSLANGMQVYLLPRQVPNVTFDICYKAGSKQEWLGATGAAHYLEHCAFLGTKNYSAGYIENLTLSCGGSYSAGTSRDTTSYYAIVPETEFPELLAFEADRMQNLIFPEKLIKNELDVIQEEMRLSIENDMFGRIFEETHRLIFDDSNYKWPVIGKPGDLPQLTRNDLLRFYKENYHPCNATLFVVGGFDVTKTKELINKYFLTIPAGPPTIYPRTPEPKLTGKRVRIMYGSTDLPLYSIAWKSVPAGHPDTNAIQLLASLLSGGESSRLNKRIVYGESLFSSISAYNMKYYQSGFFCVEGMATSIENVPKAEKAIIEEIHKIALNGIKKEELDSAKYMYLSENVFTLQSNFTLKTALSYAVLNNTLDDLKDLTKTIEKVTAEDIQRVALQYISPKDYVTVTILPESAKK